MGTRLLTTLTLFFTLFLLSAQLQPAFAQTKKQNTGYIYIIQQILVVKGNSKAVTTIKVPTKPIATPTIYIKPTSVPVTPTKALARKATPVPTKKTEALEVAPTKLSPTQSTPTQAVSSSDPMTFIMSEINKYRASRGLSSVQTSSETCNFAATRAGEIVSDFSHAGFQKRVDSKTLPYSSWTGITENLAMNSDYTKVVNAWINSPTHAANMRADTPFVCVRQSGNYFAYEGMKP